MKLTMEDIMLMRALTEISGVSPKDCMVNENLVSFVVNQKDMGKAIGKKAVNIKELESKLKKRVELFGFTEKAESMVENSFEVKVNSAKTNGNSLVIGLDSLNKKKILGNTGRLKRLKELIKRNYGLDLVLS